MLHDQNQRSKAQILFDLLLTHRFCLLFFFTVERNKVVFTVCLKEPRGLLSRAIIFISSNTRTSTTH